MADGTPDVFLWKDESNTYHVLPVDLVSEHDDTRAAEVTSFPVERGANINDHIIQQPDLLTLEVCQTQTPFPTPSRPGSMFAAPRGFTTKSVRLNIRRNLYRAPVSEELKVQPNAFQPGGLLAVTSAVGAGVGALTNAIGLTKPPGALRTQPTMKEPVTPAIDVAVFQADSPIDRIGELHDQLIQIKQNGRFCKITFRGRVYPDYLLKSVKWTSAKGQVGLGRFALEFQSLRIVENAVAKLPDPSSLRLKPAKVQARPPKDGGDPAPGASGGVQESLLSKGTGLGVGSS
jgi:hypothetical protein